MRKSARRSTYLLFVLLFSSAASAAPVLSLVAPPEKPYVGRTLVLQAIVSWEGAAGDFVIGPASFDSPDWADASLSSSEGYVSEGKNYYVQRIGLSPGKAGDFTFSGLSVPVMSPGELASGKPAVPALTLTAEPLSISVAEQSNLPAAIVIGVGISIAAVIALTFWILYRLRQRKLAGGAVPVQDERAAALHAARRHQLDGEYYEFYRALARAAAACVGDGSAQALSRKLEQRAQDVGYRGVVPTHEELSGDLKDVERYSRETAN